MFSFIEDASDGSCGDICIYCGVTPDYNSYDTLAGFHNLHGVGLLCGVCTYRVAAKISKIALDCLRVEDHAAKLRLEYQTKLDNINVLCSERGVCFVQCVQELRSASGCGIKECERAFIEASADINEAKKILRNKGIALL
jgi:hypothetical protein